MTSIHTFSNSKFTDLDTTEWELLALSLNKQSNYQHYVTEVDTVCPSVDDCTYSYVHMWTEMTKVHYEQTGQLDRTKSGHLHTSTMKPKMSAADLNN
jgi:hypothetical protein